MRRIEKLLISPPRLSSSPQLEPLLQSYNALGMRTGSRMVLSTKNRSSASASGNNGARANDLPSFADADEGMGGGGNSSPLSPLANGLLLLASTHLRAFAEARLKRSGFRDEFLDDVRDLEDGRLSCGEKRMVLGRMWRSWGRVLGWDNLAGL
jgi:nuclear-control-of-ATPase protein 2